MVLIFDENYSKYVAEAFSLLEKGNKHVSTKATIHHILKLGEDLKFPKANIKGSYSDEEVIQIAGRIGGIVITQDDDFKRIKHLGSMYKQHNVGSVYFKTHKHSRGYWEMTTYMLSRWNEMKENIEKNPIPFCFMIDAKGIHKQHF